MANNPYVNKVVYGNTTLIDITDTTAVSSDVLSGKYFYNASGQKVAGTNPGGSCSGVVWQDAQGYVHLSDEGDIPLQTKSVSPSETAQVVTPDSGYYALDEVDVEAIPSNYVGSGIVRRSSSDMTANGATVTAPSGYYSGNSSKAIATGSAKPASTISATGATVSTGTNTITLSKSVSNTPTVSAGYISSGTAGNSSVSLTATVNTRSSSDLTVSGATITAPAGYYASEASKAVASGSAGTPTATKGTVSDHAITVTPSVTNSTGYITGGTKTGTAVTVSASELVSGTYSVTSSGTKDVTNYASASVPSGTEGTPTATKGTVSNHSVSVTPSVTNSGGYIAGSTKTGTAVTVSASELVSGTKSISANGTGIDVTEYASVDVAVPTPSPTLITKSITANGTYNASSDSADGYSSVTVSVPSGSGLVYETGTWTPSEDIDTAYWIGFTNTHTVAPFFYVIWDATATYDSTSSCNGGTEYCNFGQLGEPLHTSATGSRYGYARKFIRAGTNSTANINYPYTNATDSGATYSRYWAKETGIRAEPYSTGYIWQAGRTFKWIAVWTPTT